jgi:hypothetical protein
MSLISIVFVRVRPVLRSEIENKAIIDEDKTECVTISKVKTIFL